MSLAIPLEQKLSLDGREAQLLRMKRVRMAAWAAAGVMLLQLGIFLIGMMSLPSLIALELLTAVEIALFSVCLRSGWNRHFRDPSMTAAQTLGSAAVLLLTAHCADPQARTLTMLLIPLAFAFSTFRFGTVQLLKLSLAILTMAALEAAVTSQTPAANLRADAAVLAWLGLILVLTVMSIIGGSLNDMQRRTQFERAMTQQAIGKLAEAVIAVDLGYRVNFINAGAVQLLELTNHDTTNVALAELFSLDGPQQAVDLVVRHRLNAAMSTTAPTVAVIRSRSGRTHEVEISISSINGQRGADIGFVLVLRDVTEHNSLLRELEHAATHDELTQLQNRRGFSSQLARLLDREAPAAVIANLPHALLLIDLDQFKVVNDTCGHQAGDDLLCAVASILKANFPDAVSLARLGGDEFGVLLQDIAPAQADQRANEVLRALADFRFVRNQLPFKVSASIGLTELRSGDGADEVMAQADAACYLAKEMGRKQVRRYCVNAQDMMRHQNDLQWVARINTALDNDRFVLYGQRIKAAQPGAHPAMEYELLLRMIGEDGGIIGPDQFLPTAERFNLMPAIDRWVIGAAIEQLTQVRAGGRSPPQVAINISASSLRDNSLAGFIAEQIMNSQLPGDLFTFELTESAAVINFALASEFILSVQALGCRVALDDVGTGFCSFAHLQLLPVDQIKIDGSFVRTVCDNRLDRVLVESLQRIAQVLGVTTVAEYVENDQVMAALRGIGVNYLQGYGVHRPEPLASVLASATRAEVTPIVIAEHELDAANRKLGAADRKQKPAIAVAPKAARVKSKASLALVV